MAAGVWTIKESKVAAAVSPVASVFPVAAVANGQTLGGFKPHSLFSYGPGGQKSKASVAGLRNKGPAGPRSLQRL